jgi:hypothetical protein
MRELYYIGAGPMECANAAQSTGVFFSDLVDLLPQIYGWVFNSS